MADTSSTALDAENPAPDAPKTPAGPAKKQPGQYSVPPALHQALRFAALTISFENEGNPKEKTNADDVLQEAIIKHLTQLENSGVNFPPKVKKDFDRIRGAKNL